MCLAIPGKVLAISGHAPLLRTGTVSFGGVIKEVKFVYLPEARVDDYVIVNSGYAIGTLDEAEANRILEYWQQVSTED